MTRTGRALIIGPIVVLALWEGAAAAAPAEPTPAVEDPIAARPPAPAGTASMLTLPVLGDIVAPLVLAALCAAAVAFFTDQMGGPDMAPQTPERSEAPRRSRGA